MVPESPTDALGSHAAGVRDLVVEVVRSRHGLFAEAHQVSGTRYSMGFGSQWRDLLDDTHDALTGRGFQSYKLTPAGYKLPIVNNCLVYVWRVPEAWTRSPGSRRARRRKVVSLHRLLIRCCSSRVSRTRATRRLTFSKRTSSRA